MIVRDTLIDYVVSIITILLMCGVVVMLQEDLFESSRINSQDIKTERSDMITCNMILEREEIRYRLFKLMTQKKDYEERVVSYDDQDAIVLIKDALGIIETEMEQLVFKLRGVELEMSKLKY